MPSPFPGMDPFLELPSFFPGLHDRLVTYLSELLQRNLPPPYFAEISDRLWVEVSDRYIEPDVNVFRDEPPEPHADEGGGTAVATMTTARTQPVVVHAPFRENDEHREPFLEIYSGGDRERLVTTIEVLSRANKTPGAHGQELYLRKQREMLISQVNLVEIDLLRGGEHSTAVPLSLLRRKVREFDYHVCVHRFDNLEDFFVYPFVLADRLPELAIPLLPGDPAVVIDLQAVFERCYETGPYRRRLRYPELTAIPPLNPTQAAWVQQRLTAVGTPS